MKKITIEIDAEKIISILQQSDEIVLKLTTSGDSNPVDESVIDEINSQLSEELQRKMKWPF